jgi:hypothetical protein
MILYCVIFLLEISLLRYIGLIAYWFNCLCRCLYIFMFNLSFVLIFTCMNQSNQVLPLVSLVSLFYLDLKGNSDLKVPFEIYKDVKREINRS